MSVIIQGNSGVNADVESTTRALRVVQYPPNVASDGAYMISQQTGSIAAISTGHTSGVIGSWRWTHASKLAVITRIKVNWVTVVAPSNGNAQQYGLGVYIARSFTASDSGGTAATLTGNNCKKRTSFATTQLGDFRMSTTTALTAGTRTVDSQAIMAGSRWELQIANTTQRTTLDLLWEATEQQTYPLIFAQNEGLLLENLVTLANNLAGVVTWTIEWLEVDSYPT